MAVNEGIRNPINIKSALLSRQQVKN